MKGFVIQFRAVPVMLSLATLAMAETPHRVLEQQFEQTVRPFVVKYCAGCHSGKTPAAQLDLKSYTSMDIVTADFAHWTLLMERLSAKDMPPAPLPAPPADARQSVIAWIQ